VQAGVVGVEAANQVFGLGADKQKPTTQELPVIARVVTFGSTPRRRTRPQGSTNMHCRWSHYARLSENVK
jgi:hypothetical protein